VAKEKYMHKIFTGLKQQHPPCTPGTYQRSTTGFQNAAWIKKTYLANK
jgi:hypothetical protein